MRLGRVPISGLKSLGVHVKDSGERGGSDGHSALYPQPPFEAEFSEVLLCKNELNEALNNLSRWMKDKHVDKNLVREKRTLPVWAVGKPRT